ncbi:hypothetical protein ONE63_004744 [Megalurothrips usitatus]|uniref:Hexosyltransferase n=1 Tax=Megalurothrips usitatus TaxID=439358 RepID=A0AAV7X3Z1_9NEOP|nr:hypothetical protein ONE63_004744 [Megalurothrips usitatus]
MYIAKRLLLLCSALLISFRCLEYVYEIENEVQSKDALLVIGILSAQNNYAARNSVRQTWKSFTEQRKIKFFFLVGTGVCPIHPYDRKSDLSCEALDLTSFYDRVWVPAVPDSKENFKPSKLWITSFTFRVNFPVIVRGIRVLKEAVPKSIQGYVRLKNARTGKIVTSSPALPLLSNGTTWQEIPIEPVILPKSFDLEVELSNEAFDSSKMLEECHLESSWFNFSGGIEFTTLYSPDRGWVTFNEKSCATVSLLLELHDRAKYLMEREVRSLQWQKQIVLLEESLRNEANIEKDIVLLDVLDVYKNIPTKLLQFYKWAFENLNFTFLLKSDDDTFLDIPIIEQYLKSVMVANEQIHDDSYMWWWGNLRHGLPVERHGKWQELEFAAPVYPPFPCGGGYVLNKNIVRFLAKNSKWLHTFQGEDTSLGIWLSGIHPDTPKDALCHWACGEECGKQSCNRGQLSVEAMSSVWKHYQKNHKLC